jgi:hypothetical protein
MRFRCFVISILMGVVAMANACEASPLDEYKWKNRLLVVVAPTGDSLAKEQRQIYETSGRGMSERSVILTEAFDDSERSRQIRSQLSADGKHFEVFLVGKDGHTAFSSDHPLSADYLFGKIDAMPMRRDEMRRR